MRKIITMSIAALFIVCISSLVISASPEKDEAESVEKGEIINDTCPVMGGAVDNTTPYKVEYNGKIIGFCSTADVEKFNADPEKYMSKLKEMQSAEEGEESHEGHMH